MPNLVEKLTAIGNAIRAKTGGSDMLTLDEMPDEIASIKSGGFDFSQIKTTSNGSTQYVFYNNETITLDGADFSQVSTVSSMFSSCTNLTSVDLAPLAGAPITNTSYMFSSCTNLTSVDMSMLTVTNLSLTYAFESCTSLVSIDMSGASKKIISMARAFDGCTSLETLDLSGVDITAYEASMSLMFTPLVALQTFKTGENWLYTALSNPLNKPTFPVAMQDENGTQFASGDFIPEGAHTYTAVS